MKQAGLMALLLDLDDTLIENPMESFLPAYFRALGAFMAEIAAHELLIQRLWSASRVMGRNDGKGRTNAEVFADAFYPAFELPREEIEERVDRFYLEAFPALESLTRRRPAASKIVEWAKTRGIQIVIATNPVFPRVAIEQRMAWGAIGLDRFDYDLVTCYENCRATKSNPAYYLEIADHLGRRPEECLMVGDNWEADVVCAGEAGMPSYWIAPAGASQPASEVRPVGQGNLETFLVSAQDGSLEESWANPRNR